MRDVTGCPGVIIVHQTFVLAPLDVAKGQSLVLEFRNRKKPLFTFSNRESFEVYETLTIEEKISCVC